jgi:hypothetical protein
MKMVVLAVALAACGSAAPSAAPAPTSSPASSAAPVAFGLGWLPARTRAVVYAPKHGVPILEYVASLASGEVPCVETVMNKVERSFQASDTINGPMITIAEGDVPRADVEACFDDFIAYLKLEVRVDRDGDLTTYTRPGSQPQVLGFGDHRIVIGLDAAAVRALLRATDEGTGIRGTPLAALVARMPADRMGMAMVGVETVTRNLFDVPASAVLVEMQDGPPPAATARFIAASEADANRMVANIAAFTTRKDVAEPIRRAVASADAHREGNEVVVDVMALMKDQDAAMALMQRATGSAPP